MASFISIHAILILLIDGIKKSSQSSQSQYTFGDKSMKRAEGWYFIALVGHWKQFSVMTEPRHHISYL